MTVSPAYRLAMAATTPAVRWWGRLEVEGLECLPESGPLLLAGNHDSYWDPIAIGIAGLPRRQIKALAKSSLWKPGLGWILDGMGQIPILRGGRDTAALQRAIEELNAGSCIGIFPEGTRSQGRELRARSGLARLAEAVPEAAIRCVTVTGTTDIPHFPRDRPKVRVRFFVPQTQGADPAALLAELRATAPRVKAGRRGH